MSGREYDIAYGASHPDCAKKNPGRAAVIQTETGWRRIYQ